MSHGDRVHPNRIQGKDLPEGITIDDLNRVWRAHCVKVGANPDLVKYQSMPTSRRDLLDYYLPKLIADPEWMP